MPIEPRMGTHEIWGCGACTLIINTLPLSFLFTVFLIL